MDEQLTSRFIWHALQVDKFVQRDSGIPITIRTFHSFIDKITGLGR